MIDRDLTNSRFPVRCLARRPGMTSWDDARLMVARQRLLRRYRGRTLAERKLHHHGVEPAAEFEADARMGADHLETALPVQADGGRVGGVADDSDHLAEAARGAGFDQLLHQPRGDAAAVADGVEIDRVLHRETVGRPRPV